MSTPEQPRTDLPDTASTATPPTSRPSAAPRAGSDDPTAPALTRDGVPLARVRRAPRVFPFLVTGAVLGALLGLVLQIFGGEGGNYTDTSATGYVIVLGAVLGGMLGGIAFAIADRRS